MFGSHLSIAGGMHNALLSAEKLNCETVQVFTIFIPREQWMRGHDASGTEDLLVE
jgi:hypothetical protein